ncbi:MAG: hypothetical protein K8T89_07040 [Planctomycetes bacterium]|nr:hypothetical protein [Planctomycetota bacterium]
MQTVNFNCSNCQKLMAVGMNLLGRNVRCPHCKSVVQAPATAGPAKQPPPPTVAPPTVVPTMSVPVKPQESHESIFGEVHDDDVFGTRPPKVKMPTEPNPVPMHTPAKLKETEPTVQVYTPSNANNFNNAATQEFQQANDFAPANAPWSASNRSHDEIQDHHAVEENETGRSQAFKAAARPIERKSGGGGIFIWMILFYAVVASGVAGYLYFLNMKHEEKTPEAVKDHVYLAIPDVFGYYERASRKEPAKIEGMPAVNLDLPKELEVQLGDTLRVGDLEVSPIKVESREIASYRKMKGQNLIVPNPYTFRKLFVLHLELKNLSEDVTFHPTDPYFSRRFSPQNELDGKPYTGIVIGKTFLMGGPFPWPSKTNEREYIEGQQNDDKPFEPKEKRNVIIGSDIDVGRIQKAVDQAGSEMITWRVQLRRGLVKCKDKEGKEQEISASCVIGVNFKATDILER